MRGWFVTTFISSDQLSSAQRSYLDQYQGLLELFSTDAIRAAFTLCFDQTYSGSKIAIKEVGNDEHLQRLIVNIRSKLATSYFRVQPRSMMSHIVDADITPSEYKNLIWNSLKHHDGH